MTPMTKIAKSSRPSRARTTGATPRLVHYTQIYERPSEAAAASAILTTTVGGNTTNTGIANTTYYNLGADVTPMKELSIIRRRFLLRATKTGAWEDIVGDNVSKKIGWEIDSKISYKLAKNLTDSTEVGIFKVGDFYKDAFVDEAERKTVTRHFTVWHLTF